MQNDSVGSRLGMWLFLFTELMLFGGLFLLYAVYSNRYPAEFSRASKELSTIMGSLNTVVLLTSSLFVVLAVAGIRNNKPRHTVAFLLATIACAGIFLGVKSVEWSEKYHHGLFPNTPTLLAKPKGEIVFFNLYFTITGLHAIHIIIGAIVLGIITWSVYSGKTSSNDYVSLENSGLYWHLVDLIWIYIFPLFYLVVP
ncbi:MAG: cytochrome c oxidase subunit 3 [Candidatus Riflebacteria bacterium]|nr:cytochrome c oxidase subunit 3 [Candidatus Riflebacteria bacterium]